MRRSFVLVVAFALFMGVGVVPALADAAEVDHGEDTWEGVEYGWGNPCTGEAVVITVVADIKATDVWANGHRHMTRQAVFVSGSSTDGWIVVDGRTNHTREGVNDWSDAGTWLWQLHITLENPATGQRYTALTFYKVTINGNGDWVVDGIENSGHNTCLGN